MRCEDYNLPKCAYCLGEENLLGFECWLDEINNTICTGYYAVELMPKTMTRRDWFINWINSAYMDDEICEPYVIAVVKTHPELENLLILL